LVLCLITNIESVSYTQTVKLGGIGSYEQIRRIALANFDENALFDQLIPVNALSDSIVKVATIHVGVTYHLFGQVHGAVDLASLLTTGIDFSLTELKRDSIKSRDLINQIPQNMIMEIPLELSNIWTVTDDIVNTILMYLRQ
jgi:hypothetical protein